MVCSPERTSTGSPGNSRMNPNARMEIPMKVGITRSNRWRTKRSMEKGRELYAPAPKSLLGDVDGLEVVKTKRIDRVAGDLLGQRHGDHRVGDQDRRIIVVHDDLRLFVERG